MNAKILNRACFRFNYLAGLAAVLFLAANAVVLSCQEQKKAASTAASAQKTFATPQDAASALIQACQHNDAAGLEEILGPSGHDLIDTGEPVKDKKQIEDFAARASEKNAIEIDPKNPARAVLMVGNEDWPSPVPIVKRNGKWLFDSKAGRREVLYRRIGDNELAVIDMLHGYVEAQAEYSLVQHDDSGINQYAQKIISTPGKQDGLAWQNADGSWAGPVGEAIAKVLAEGYTPKTEPYHGYRFKVLKGQGPAAHLGRMSYLVNGFMIGGFALVAVPAEYRITGVNTFIVNNDGVIYQKDLGPDGASIVEKMDEYNPDKTWTAVE